MRSEGRVKRDGLSEAMAKGKAKPDPTKPRVNLGQWPMAGDWLGASRPMFGGVRRTGGALGAPRASRHPVPSPLGVRPAQLGMKPRAGAPAVHRA